MSAPAEQTRKRRLLLDLSPLRESPAFRRLWLGNTLGSIGQEMTVVTVAL
ncbi:MFS transporter, partial [Mycolicibacterium sphagni]|nr:MFS transporter [Mycolicibacterium sphagni]